MKGIFVHSHIFLKNNEKYYSEGKLTYEMWRTRYLKYLSCLFVAGRQREVYDIADMNISSGSNVKHIELVNTSNPIVTLISKKKNYNILEKTILENDIQVIIARLPSEQGLTAIKVAKKLNKKLIVEFVGDPFNALWYHGKLIAKMYAPISYIKHKYHMRKLDNIIFVTEEYLQNKYKKNHLQYNTTNISNVFLQKDEKFNVDNKKIDSELINREIINIATIGSYSAKYKGIDTGIKALKKLREKGVNAHFYILGSGNKNFYSPLITELNMQDYIHFVDPLPGGKKVLDWLDQFDFYIHPSLTEGLPRSVVEAMSRGIPCVGTDVGGIPELLQSNMLIKVNDYSHLAGTLLTLMKNKNKYNEQIDYNFEKSKEYEFRNLTIKRDEFWKKALGEEKMK